MKIFILTLSILSILISSCQRSGTGKCTETNLSTPARASHNRGRDCSKCHTYGRDGRGCFTIAGSAFESDTVTPMQNAVMVLFSKDSLGNITGSSKPIPLDKCGNFYTTQSISFLNKYPAIIRGRDTSIMLEPLTTGACNSCHSPNDSKEPNLIKNPGVYIYSQH